MDAVCRQRDGFTARRRLDWYELPDRSMHTDYQPLDDYAGTSNPWAGPAAIRLRGRLAAAEAEIARLESLLAAEQRVSARCAPPRTARLLLPDLVLQTVLFCTW